MRIKGIDGLPVLDALEPMDLIITRQDIAKADVKHPEGCAVARACNRQLHALETRVHLGRVYVKTNKDHWVRYITPRPLRAEIIAFDRGGVFEPGEFRLPAPQPTKRATGKQQGGPSRRTAKQRAVAPKRRAYHVVSNVRTGPA